MTDTVRLIRYLDAGAVDVYSSPLHKDHVHSLAVHAYRVHKEVAKEEPQFLVNRRSRKMSWVGVNEQKPYAYLREAMVSGLMQGICNPENVTDSINPNDVNVTPARRQMVAEAVGSWSFSAHDFNDDELLLGALAMLQHALTMPELENWHMDSDELLIFLLASRTAYNEFVLYHNFRHVVDVLQALFTFLVQIGTLPPYPPGSKPESGVNNAFLVALNSPLAQLYNDRSVLESFHCAAYSQILRRYWPSVFADIAMRKLMINSILATDMGLHFKYMSDLGNLQDKLAHNNFTTDGWSVKVCEEYKDLACGLLIKCADISNVARRFHVAAQWAIILTDEFSHQGMMEVELGIPTCLFGGPPERNNPIKMAQSQIGFMNIFARPLFEAVTGILPAMRFSVDQILENKKVWENRIEEQKEKTAEKRGRKDLLSIRTLDGAGNGTASGAVSPRSRSLVDPNGRKSSQPGSEQHSPTSGAMPRPPTIPTDSRRSSLGPSRRGSEQNAIRSTENAVQQERRGSNDPIATANLTTILIHQQAKQQKNAELSATQQSHRSVSPARKPEPGLDTPSADEKTPEPLSKADSLHLGPAVNGSLETPPLSSQSDIPRQGVVNTDEEQDASCCATNPGGDRRKSEKRSAWRRKDKEAAVAEKSPVTSLTPVASRSSSTPNVNAPTRTVLERTTSEGKEGDARGSKFGFRFWRRKFRGEEREGSPVQEVQQRERAEEGTVS
ncbi:3',5'-cyclic-nucleotide phosphodiesterase [Coniosporium tulheliwenetii]|uniref:3',5'-cyclic-nucleotide phosphodiesterase n=1 Tax=Coniosporium tulheliwenetii TaxID=3383036 RepID=A0ACC2Z846_9PEZI|nr:3',5'-cyclic-nucleotide phosphodiesterase [Cladosporium sp. JES 115]